MWSRQRALSGHHGPAHFCAVTLLINTVASDQATKTITKTITVAIMFWAWEAGNSQ